MKTEVVHTRVDPSLKSECDDIFSKLGLTTSHAITLFLNQVVLHGGLPFSLSIPNSGIEEVKFAENINSVDGTKPSEKGERIMELYANGEIDYETAQFAIKRLYK